MYIQASVIAARNVPVIKIRSDNKINTNNIKKASRVKGGQVKIMYIQASVIAAGNVPVITLIA